ncbi:hypothetical protein [Microbulbifer hainanensis]|uniref:hypothetical protein n=1 Tax=Microbulbifer hainanensis TaxID=2735675 RepID=UPI0018677865|nr:hypothetical protein [Microbulbifer hainanensis]
MPLPLANAGTERDALAFPESGTVVELAFAFGQPNQPFIRTVLSRGVGVPAIDRDEQLWQQSEAVRQKIDAGGHWLRETLGDIQEDSLRRILSAAENLEAYGTEHKQVREHSVEEIAGAKIIEALGALRLLSGGTLNVSALDNLNLTTASDINSTAGRDLKERVGNVRDSLAKPRQEVKVEVEDGGTLWLGSETVNVLQVLSDLISVVSSLAGTLKSHSHAVNGAPPDQQSEIGENQGDADSLNSSLIELIG